MTRFSSNEEVNAALLELEEQERATSSEKASSEKHFDLEKPRSKTTSGVISTNGRSAENGTEENGEVHDDIPDSDSDSGSDIIDAGQDDDELDDENHDDDSEDDDDDDDDDDGDGSVSDEDDEVHVRQKIPDVDPLEAADFDQELKAVLQESMEQRRQELRGRPTLNMMLPMSIFESSAKDHHGRGTGGDSGDEATDEAGGNKEVQVKVLVKRGSKQQTKQMYIPSDCSLIQSTKQKEAAELEEKQDIKRLVLEYNDREEEELHGLGTQTTNWVQTGGSRVGSRGNTWEGASGRGTGTRHRYQNYSGGSGGYYGRRR